MFLTVFTKHHEDLECILLYQLFMGEDDCKERLEDKVHAEIDQLIQKMEEVDTLCLCSRKKCDRRENSENQFEICSRCRIARYCSKKCQKKDWKKHKRSCKTAFQYTS